MRRRWLSTAVLFLLVAALGGWVWWLQHQPQPQTPSLTDLDPKSVRQIHITHGDQSMVFRRQGEGWWMQQPYQAPADAYRTERVLDLPKSESHASYAIAEAELGRFGLAPPRAVVRLDGHEFRLGNQNPIDFRRYVQVDGGKVHLIDDTLFHLLTSPASDWIDTRLLPSGTIRALEGPGWRIHLTEKGSWQAEPQVEEETLRRFVDEWRNARALRVSPYDKAVPEDAETIRIRLQDREVRLLILQREPELILLRPDLKLRYHFYGQIGRRLLQPETGGKNRDSAS